MTASSGVVSFAWSRDGDLVAWSTSNGTVRQWETAANLLRAPIVLASSNLLAYSRPVPSIIAVADDRRAIVRLVDSRVGSLGHIAQPATRDEESRVIALTCPLYETKPEFGRAGINIPSSVPAPDGCFAVYSNKSVSLYKYSSECISTFASGGKIVCAAFSEADGSFPSSLCTGDQAGVCRVWRLKNRKVDCSFLVKSHTSWVTEVSFSPDASRLASCSFDGTARVWDITAKRRSCGLAVYNMDLDGIRSRPHAISYSGRTDVQFIACGGNDQKVWLWTVYPGAQVRTSSSDVLVNGHSASVYAVLFDPSGSRLVSGSSDGFVRISELPSNFGEKEYEERASAASGRSGNTESECDVRAFTSTASVILWSPCTSPPRTCPVCQLPFDRELHQPYLSSCGHTYACEACHKKLWDYSELGDQTKPRCQQCLELLSDCSPNFELLRLLTDKVGEGNRAEAGQPHAVVGESELRLRPFKYSLPDLDYIPVDRLRWVEDANCETSSSAFTIAVSAIMDYEAATVKLARRFDGTSPTSSSEAHERIEREFRLLSRVRGPHVLQFYGASRVPDPDGRLLLVSELMRGGSLANSLSRFRQAQSIVDVDTVVNLCGQLAKALLYLHRSGVARPSLEPDFLMLSEELDAWTPSCRLKLCDFGCSVTKFGAANSNSVTAMTSGNPRYLAPEALDPEGLTADMSDMIWFERAQKMDSYALGVVMFELASGIVPWDRMRNAQVISAVAVHEQRPGFVPTHLPVSVRELISELWAQDPGDRPSMDQTVTRLSALPSAPMQLREDLSRTQQQRIPTVR